MIRAPGQTRIIWYIQCQISEIREGGRTVVLRKVRRLLSEVVFLLPLPLLLPVVLAVRALRPFVLIRFGSLFSKRIGHFTVNTELYLCERDAGIHPQNTVDVFYHMKPICNRQLQKMWERTPNLHIVQLVSLLDRLNRLLPGSQLHVIPLPSDRDTLGLMTRFPPHLAFTDEEERRGQIALQAMGIPEGAPFVCFHARDSVYLNKIMPGCDFCYHDYRNSCIHNYISAVEELVRRGYFAIRMGAVVKEALKIANPRIIDYATNGTRTDFMDIYLGAKCRFFIGDTAGIYGISRIFQRPVAWANLIPLEYAPTSDQNDLFIPKKLWLRAERRLMTFREILESGVGRLPKSQQYVQFGIEVIDNMPEEIMALAVEMDERLNGTWQTTEEDEELQRRFWSLFKPSELNGVLLSRIGTEFLRQNRKLLE